LAIEFMPVGIIVDEAVHRGTLSPELPLRLTAPDIQPI